MAKTAVIYARYSCSKQREVSIDDQFKACFAYCEREGITVVGTYHDAAMSGTNDHRPDFQRMIKNAPESDYIVVYMMERFSRDKYDAPIYKQQLERKGVRVISALEYIPDTPEGILIEKLLEGQAAYYSLDMSRKISRGLNSNAAKCMSNGYKYFGYDTDPQTRRYIINEEEAAAVREVFAMLSHGHARREAVELLNNRGFRTSKGNPINLSFINRMLKNEAYIGVYSYNGTSIPDGMPKIVDEATFRAASSTPAGRKKNMDNFAEFPLTGKLICALCGQPMHGTSGTGRHGGKYTYYCCNTKDGCGRKPIPQSKLENALMEAVLEVADNPEVARRIAEAVVKLYQEEGSSKAALDACQARLKSNTDAIHNIEKAAEAGIVTAGLKERLDQLQEDRIRIECELSTLKANTNDVTVEEVTEFLLHGFAADDKDMLLDGYINQVFLFDGYAVATLNFRGESNELEEVRIALDALKYKKNPCSDGFDLCSCGGLYAHLSEPLPLNHAVGIILRFAA
jgi:DNA invertase Pin-like site-specific DNA recombinase